MTRAYRKVHTSSDTNVEQTGNRWYTAIASRSFWQSVRIVHGNLYIHLNKENFVHYILHLTLQTAQQQSMLERNSL
jgi:hypothetical protein